MVDVVFDHAYLNLCVFMCVFDGVSLSLSIVANPNNPHMFRNVDLFPN